MPVKTNLIKYSGIESINTFVREEYVLSVSELADTRMKDKQVRYVQSINIYI